MRPKTNLRLSNRKQSSDQKVGAPAFLWWIVGLIALIEFTLSAADAGVIGTLEWRWLAFTYGAYWQPLSSNDVAPIFSGQIVTMFITYAFLHGSILHFLMNGVVFEDTNPRRERWARGR